MTPDKAQQLGNDLACLAASISEIAEELKAMYDFDHEAELQIETEPPKAVTLEEVRGVLAEKSRSGNTDAVRELLAKYGANKLSEIDPAKYSDLIAEAEVIGNG